MKKTVRFEVDGAGIQIGDADTVVEIQVMSDRGNDEHEGVRTAAIWLPALGARQVARAIEEAADVAEKAVQREAEDTQADREKQGKKS